MKIPIKMSLKNKKLIYIKYITMKFGWLSHWLQKIEEKNHWLQVWTLRFDLMVLSIWSFFLTNMFNVMCEKEIKQKMKSN